MANPPSVEVRSWEGEAASILSAGPYQAVFLPEVGMLGASLKHDGTELLSLHGGVEAYREGHTTGLPLLHPWANRLSARHYHAAGVDVDLDRDDLHVDGNGRPIHGTMHGAEHFQVVSQSTSGPVARMRARFDYRGRPDLIEPFPFPHELDLDVEVGPDGLTIATTVRPTAPGAVPISFGFHPYFTLPGVQRSALRVLLPDREQVMLDDRNLPTGERTAETATEVPLGDRALDDHYRLTADRRLGLSDGERVLVVDLDDGYRYAQVYAPPGETFVALEPMTAAVNALVDGGFEIAEPGAPFTATFRVALEV